MCSNKKVSSSYSCTKSFVLHLHPVAWRQPPAVDFACSNRWIPLWKVTSSESSVCLCRMHFKLPDGHAKDWPAVAKVNCPALSGSGETSGNRTVVSWQLPTRRYNKSSHPQGTRSPWRISCWTSYPLEMGKMASRNVGTELPTKAS